MFEFFKYLLITLFVALCLILILLVLIQKGRGGGLASAFGGGGGNTAFGSKTGDVLTWATSVVFGVFVLLAISLNLMANSEHAKAVSAAAAAAGPSGGTSVVPPPQPTPADGGATPSVPTPPTTR